MLRTGRKKRKVFLAIEIQSQVQGNRQAPIPTVMP
jgi:hypothetical protein